MTILKLIFGNLLNVKKQIDNASTFNSVDEFLNVFYIAFVASIKEYQQSHPQLSTQAFQLERAVSLPDSREKFLQLFDTPIDNLSTFDDLIQQDSKALNTLSSKVQSIVGEYANAINFETINSIIPKLMSTFPKNVLNALSEKQSLYILLCKEFSEDNVRKRILQLQESLEPKVDVLIHSNKNISEGIEKLLANQNESEKERTHRILLPVFEKERKKGIELLKEKKAVQAINFFNDLESKVRDNGLEQNRKFLAKIKNNIAACYSQMLDSENATRCYVEAVELDQTEANLYNAANSYAKSKNYEKIDELAEKILQINPNSSKGYALKIANVNCLKKSKKVWNDLTPDIQNGIEPRFAIAVMHMKEGKDKQAIIHFRKALEFAPDNIEIKLNLAALLTTPKIEKYHVLIKPNYNHNEIKNLEEAIILYQEVWQKYKNSEAAPYHVDVLLNISSIQNLIGKVDCALSTIDQCLNFTPDNDYFKYHKVLYLMDLEKFDDAIELIQTINPTEIPDILLIQAQLFANHRSRDEALNFAHDFLQKFPKHQKVKSAYHFIAALHLRDNRINNAEKIIRKWLSQNPDDMAFLILNAKLQASKHEDKSLTKELKNLCEHVDDFTNQLDLHELSQALFLNHQWYEAIEIFERYINKERPTLLTLRLLECYYFTANWNKGLELCNLILKKNGFIRNYAEFKMNILCRMRNFKSASRICTQLLKKFPNEKLFIFQYADISLKLGKKSSCKKVLSKLNYLDLTIDEVSSLVQIYIDELGEAERTLDIIYEFRRKHNDVKSHILYWKMFLNFNDAFSKILKNPNKVQKNSVVFLKIGEAQIQELIIENRERPNEVIGELNFHSYVYQKIKDKKVGKEFIWKKGNIKNITAKIVEIKNKWIYALHKTQLFFETRWAHESPFEIFYGTSEETIQFLNTQIDTHGKKPIELEFVEQEYKKGRIPIGIIADRLDKNPIEVYEYFSQNNEVGIKSCYDGSGFLDKVNLLNKSEAPSICADVFGLLGLFKSGVKKNTLQQFGKIKVSYPTIQIVKKYLDILKFESRGNSVSYFVKDEIRYRQEISTEQKLKQFEYWNEFHQWIERNCDFLPTIPNEEVSELVFEALGASSASTILLAQQHNCIFLSDDFCTRSFVEGKYHIKGIWTQVFLYWMSNKEMISPREYGDTTIKLFLLNYSNVQIGINTILAASFESLDVFGEIIKSLESNDKDHLKNCIFIGVSFLLTLWWVNKESDEKNLAMTFWILIALCKNHSRKAVNNSINNLLKSSKRRGKIHPKLAIVLLIWFKS